MKKIQLLLIEDNRLLRDWVMRLLRKQPDFKVVAAGNYETVSALAQKAKPDVFFWSRGTFMSLANMDDRRLLATVA